MSASSQSALVGGIIGSLLFITLITIVVVIVVMVIIIMRCHRKSSQVTIKNGNQYNNAVYEREYIILIVY